MLVHLGHATVVVDHLSVIQLAELLQLPAGAVRLQLQRQVPDGRPQDQRLRLPTRSAGASTRT